MTRNKNKIIYVVTVPHSIGFFKDVMLQMSDEGYDTVVVTSPGNPLDEFVMRNPDKKVIRVPMARHISIFKDIKSILKMVRVFHHERPYMVHSMTPKAGLVAMLAAWFTRVPIRIHTFTGLVWPTATGFKRTILMLADKIICACATHIIPEGQGVLNDLKNYSVSHRPMKVLGYGNVRGIDMDRFNPSRFTDVKKNTNEFRYIFVGRLVGDKGINELVEAFIRINANYPNTRLVLVGEFESNLDPLRSNTIKSINDNPNIISCGPQYGDDLLIKYMQSDCFVLPSYREGFPNTLIEAGAMGLPSVATNVNGSREIILNGRNGLIVEPHNIEALYLAMKTMLLDESLREEMAACARDLIGTRYEKSYVQNCLRNFYNELLAK